VSRRCPPPGGPRAGPGPTLCGLVRRPDRLRSAMFARRLFPWFFGKSTFRRRPKAEGTHVRPCHTHIEPPPLEHRGRTSRTRPCTTKPRARTPTGLLRQRLVCGDKFVRSFERAKTGTNRHVRSPSAACGRAAIPAGSEHRRAPARVPARARAETAVTGASASHVLGLEARSTRAASG
jgi:hypothetical protein